MLKCWRVEKTVTIVLKWLNKVFSSIKTSHIFKNIRYLISLSNKYMHFYAVTLDKIHQKFSEWKLCFSTWIFDILHFAIQIMIFQMVLTIRDIWLPEQETSL